jgi:hypothetical protein
MEDARTRGEDGARLSPADLWNTLAKDQEAARRRSREAAPFRTQATG